MMAAVRRGLGRALAIAVFASLLGATSAWGGTISARPVNMFGSAVTTIAQGETVTFQNMDIAGHDVTSNQTGDDGAPLFRSALVSPGSSGPVEGTEYLTTGNYDFYCSIHPGMEAVLEVTSEGTPVPRPEPEGVAVKIVSRSLERVIESRKLKLKVQSRRGEVLVGARAKTRKTSIALGSKKLEFEKADERKVTLKLSDSARKALRKRKSATLIATATASHGDGHTERATARRKLD
jgi:plastocyanin